jgi:hypothetical protein
MQIMIAQHYTDGIPRFHAAAQGFFGIRASVDQIAQKVDGIAAGREIYFCEQALQSAIASLDIADTVK